MTLIQLTIPKRNNLFERDWKRVDPWKEFQKDPPLWCGATACYVPTTVPLRIEDPKNFFTLATWNIGMDYKPHLVLDGREIHKSRKDLMRRLGADILGLQEAWDYDGLQKFNDEHKPMRGRAYPYTFLPPSDNGEEMEVALLSKFPIRRVYVYSGKIEHEGYTSVELHRPIVEAILQVGHQMKLRVFVVHLKCGEFGEQIEQNQAETRFLAHVADEHLDYSLKGNDLVAMVGDFNNRETLHGKMCDSQASDRDGNRNTWLRTEPFDRIYLSPKLLHAHLIPQSNRVYRPWKIDPGKHVPVVVKLWKQPQCQEATEASRVGA